jgi:hypothetical protein
MYIVSDFCVIYICRAHYHTIIAPYACTATHCHALPHTTAIVLPHTAARTEGIACTPPCLLPNTATHRPTHCRAHCRTLLHTAALSDSRRLPCTLSYAVCRMHCMPYVVCHMSYTVCHYVVLLCTIIQSASTNKTVKTNRAQPKTTKDRRETYIM